jgi:selenocysteine-specific elongation factor
MLLARPESVSTSDRLLVSLRPVRTLDEELTDRGAYHLHLGSGSWPVRLRVLDPGLGMVRLRAAIPVRAGDRFIIRETGRRAVVGGGVVLDPRPSRSPRRALEGAPALVDAVSQGPDRIADVLLAGRGTADLDELRRDSGGGTPQTVYTTATMAMADAAAAGLLDSIAAAVTDYQRNHRLRPGILKAELATTLGVPVASIALVVAGTPDLVDEGATIRTAGFEPGLSTEEERAWQDAQETLRAGPGVPRADQLGLSRELLHALVRDDKLVRVSDDLVYLPPQIEEITTALRTMAGEFTVAEFRDLIGVTRRQAVPLLEWFDKHGLTRRRGDLRVVRR